MNLTHRRHKLQLIKLTGRTVRIGRDARYGPVFLLSHYDHSREVFTARSVHTGIESRLPLAALALAFTEGSVHVSKIPGGVYYA